MKKKIIINRKHTRRKKRYIVCRVDLHSEIIDFHMCVLSRCLIASVYLAVIFFPFRESSLIDCERRSYSSWFYRNIKFFLCLTYLRFVGNSSTRRHRTTLMLREVKASNIHESTRFCVEVFTKKKAIVTAQAIVAVNTENKIVRIAD